MRPIFLIGFIGAGKTTVGRLVAEKLDRAFCDLDREIESAASRSVDQLFEMRGEAGFREVERETLERVSGHEEAIIACGGGVVTDEGSRQLLPERGDVVYLAVTPEEAIARIGADTVGRPLIRGEFAATAPALLASRERLYEQVADLTVVTLGKTPEQVADRIVEWARGRQ
jgi:shikimate kinase